MWFAPFLFALLIEKAMQKMAHLITTYFSISIPFLPFILYLIFLVCFFSLFLSLSFSLIQIIRLFIQTDFFTQLLTTLQSIPLPPFLYSSFESLIHQLMVFLSSALMVFPQLFTFLSLTFLIACLLLFHPHQFDSYLNQLPPAWKKQLNQLQFSFFSTTKKIFLSSLILMCLTWIECWLGLILLHEPHAFSLSLLIACFDSLPLLGVGVVLLPLSLAQWFFGFPKKALGLFLLFLVITALRFVIEPKLLAKQMGIPVIFHVLSMMICVNLFGGLGFLYAPFLCILSMDILHNSKISTHTTTKGALT